ncbi:MAG: DUF2132 domain-containing protein [Desulfobulbaceae bacterium]|uniref:DUF2132 domain-containing protein n=1 Tax=Candidatus Desulfatifera sulfidica TaxID=2841691 RepID=A0A8J6N9L4_9BACT|nr:DUF2132 domain-containing protein [Candidatus Desulfatifera sulfidica]
MNDNKTDQNNQTQADPGVIKNTPHVNDPMHGVTLEMILTRLVQRYGWDKLSAKISINCFSKDPSIKSSLKFLRKTPWARKKVESLYLRTRFIKQK